MRNMQPKSNAPFVTSGFGIFGAQEIGDADQNEEDDASVQGFWLAPDFWKSGRRVAATVSQIIESNRRARGCSLLGTAPGAPIGLQLDLISPVNPNFRLRVVVEKMRGRTGETMDRLMLRSLAGLNVELRIGDLEKCAVGDSIDLEWVPVAKTRGFPYFKGEKR